MPVPQPPTASAAAAGAAGRGQSRALSMNNATTNATTNTTETDESAEPEHGPTVWFVGVALYLAGAVLATLGLNLQRWRTDERRQQRHVRTGALAFFEQRVWWVGFVLLVSDGVLSLLAYAFASQTKLAPLAPVSLVLNHVAAPTCLKQPVRKWDRGAALTVVVGAVVAVACANPRTPDYTLDELLGYMVTVKVAVYLGVINGALLAALCAVRALSLRRKAVESERQRLHLQYRDRDGPSTLPAERLHSGRSSPTSATGSADQSSLVTAPSEMGPESDLEPEPEPEPEVLVSHMSPPTHAGLDRSDAGASPTGDAAATAAGQFFSEDPTDSDSDSAANWERDAGASAAGNPAAAFVEAQLRDGPLGGLYRGWMKSVHSVVLAAAAGIVGGQAVMFGKISVSESSRLCSRSI